MSETGSSHPHSESGKHFQRHFTWSSDQQPQRFLGQQEKKPQKRPSQVGRPTHSLSRSQSLVPTLDHHQNHHHFTHHQGRFPGRPRHQSTCSVSAIGFRDEFIDDIEDTARSSTSLWGEFEEHLHSIDTDSVQFQVKPATSKGSLLFKEAMEEEYRLRETFPKTVGTAFHVNRFRESISNAILKEEDEEEGEEGSGTVGTRSPDDSGERNNSANHTNASRCWTKMKIDLQEQHLENKLSEETTGWNLVQRTKFNINDPGDIRQELYDKYLRRSHQHWWLEGLHNYQKYKRFFDNRSEPQDGRTQSARKTKRAALSGHTKGRFWVKANCQKRPMTTISGCGQREIASTSPDCGRPMTTLESGS